MAEPQRTPQSNEVTIQPLSREFRDLAGCHFIGVQIEDRSALTCGAAKAWCEFSSIGAKRIGVSRGQLDAFETDMAGLCSGKLQFTQEVAAAARVHSTIQAWTARMRTDEPTKERLREIDKAITAGYHIFGLTFRHNSSFERAEAIAGIHLTSKTGRDELQIDYQVLKCRDVFPGEPDFIDLNTRFPESAAQLRLAARYVSPTAPEQRPALAVTGPIDNTSDRQIARGLLRIINRHDNCVIACEVATAVCGMASVGQVLAFVAHHPETLRVFSGEAVGMALSVAGTVGAAALSFILRKRREPLLEALAAVEKSNRAPH